MFICRIFLESFRMSDRRILVIEDNEFLQGLLSLSLKEEGYEVVCADDGQKGFEKAVTEDFDLIITDIQMPQWNGLESIYGLDLVKNKAKIIVISGFIDIKTRGELKDYENVISVLDKPFDTLALLEYVREVLKTKASIA